jgi:hypothetical protein
MSIEIHVFSDKPLISTEEWQAAVNAERFDLHFPKGVSIGELQFSAGPIERYRYGI